MSVTLTCLLMKKNKTPEIAAVSVVHRCASRIHLRFQIPACKVKTSIVFFSYFYPHCACFGVELLIVSHVSRGSGSAEVARWVTGSSGSRARVEASPSAGTSRLWERHILKTQRKKQQDRPRFGSAAGWTKRHGRRTARLLRVDKVADSSSRWVYQAGLPVHQNLEIELQAPIWSKNVSKYILI